MATVDTSTCPDRGCWRSASTTAPAAKVTRSCTPISCRQPYPASGLAVDGVGRPALDGRDLYRHRLAADAIYRAVYQRQFCRTLG